MARLNTLIKLFMNLQTSRTLFQWIWIHLAGVLLVGFWPLFGLSPRYSDLVSLAEFSSNLHLSKVNNIFIVDGSSGISNNTFFFSRRRNPLDKTAWETNNPVWRSEQHLRATCLEISDCRNLWRERNSSGCHISKAKGCWWFTSSYCKQQERRGVFCSSAISFKLRCHSSSYTISVKSRDDQRHRFHLLNRGIFPQK